jgi:hypothetical protein
MLKIKDNVDLKELETFGFREVLDEHYKSTYNIQMLRTSEETPNIINEYTSYIYFDKTVWCWDIKQIDDLIKADLVEE